MKVEPAKVGISHRHNPSLAAKAPVQKNEYRGGLRGQQFTAVLHIVRYVLRNVLPSFFRLGFFKLRGGKTGGALQWL